jgi:hypothetical protein
LRQSWTGFTIKKGADAPSFLAFCRRLPGQHIHRGPHTQAIVDTVERVLAQRDAAAAMNMLTGQPTTEGVEGGLRVAR